MKKAFIFSLCFTLFFSCKKEKSTTPAPTPEPIKTGTVTINVVTYDSLGDKESDFSGVQVVLTGTAFSATTTANGQVTFSNVPYGQVLPVLLKPYYEGAPTSLNLNSSSLNVTLPCAKFCNYIVKSSVIGIYNRNTIPLIVDLYTPIPAGRFCKIALIYSDTTLNVSNFLAVDTIKITSQNDETIEVANMPHIKTAIDQLPTGKYFYLNAIPVSCGPFESNVFGTKTILLGDNIYLQPNIALKKSW